MNKKIKFILVFVLIIFVSNGLFAQRMMSKRGNSHTGNRMMMAGKMKMQSPMMLYRVLEAKKTELKVTDKQLSKIKELAFNWERKRINFKANNDSLKLELKSLLLEDNLNYKKIRVIMDKISAARTDYFIGRLQVREEIKKILTNEQIGKLKNMRTDMRKRLMMNMKNMRSRRARR